MDPDNGSPGLLGVGACPDGGEHAFAGAGMLLLNSVGLTGPGDMMGPDRALILALCARCLQVRPVVGALRGSVLPATLALADAKRGG